MKWFAHSAWLPGGLSADVLFEVADGRFTQVTAGAARPADAEELAGVVFAGFANAHSHAFHRALRGRTQDDRGSFWTWRQRMYAVAATLDPDQYLNLATATYAEMALAGVTAVGEFHYLHHAPDGRPYADANEMSEALRGAASAAGIRLTLLDTCYLAGGLTASGHTELDQVQRRFADSSVEAWQARAAAYSPDEHTLAGSAIHSVRAVPRADLGDIARACTGPLHIHLSEQPAENEACQQFYGLSPTELLEAEGVLSDRTVAVHATHLSPRDIATLGRTGTGICLCPSTERDLADGIGPAAQLQQAGSALSLGTDQHAMIDLLDEARGIELHERLASLQRGRFSADELVNALTHNGHRAIGWSDAGRIEVGARADLVAVRLDSVRTAGVRADQIVYAAGAADVDTVVVDGRVIVRDGEHVLGNVAHLLSDAIEPLWSAR